MSPISQSYSIKSNENMFTGILITEQCIFIEVKMLFKTRQTRVIGQYQKYFQIMVQTLLVLRFFNKKNNKLKYN